AKPYFGDLEHMTYAAALERLLALTATGKGGAYEDGRWPDRSYRQRCFDWVRAIEGSVATEASPSIVGGLAALDDPDALLARFIERYPLARSRKVSRADAAAFVTLCKRPGKPVCFVP